MARGDIKILEQASAQGGRGSRLYNVAAAATAIYAGEPVAVNALADVTVIIADNNSPTVGTDFYVGIAETDSTQTASVAGTVNVFPLDVGTTYLIKPKVAATYDTQAEYDALVGKRVLIDLTGGVYTLLAVDGANYGCVIQPLNVTKYPGVVAFAIRAGANYLA